jgi:hypothetical protein
MRKLTRRNDKKAVSGELTDDSSPDDFKNSLTSLKKTINEELKWSLFEIDQCDFFNLLTFIQFKPEQDKNTRVINGQIYRRANKPPSWL